mgnify:FL=1
MIVKSLALLTQSQLTLICYPAPAAKKPTPSAAPQRYDPSNIYRNKVAPRRPASAAAAGRPIPAARNNIGSRPPSAAAAAQRNNVCKTGYIFMSSIISGGF